MAIALSIAYTATPLAAGTKLAIYMTDQVSPGINFLPKSRYKLVLVTAAAAASPANVLSAYTALFGSLISGRKILVRVKTINSSGLASQTFESSVVVT